MKIAWFCQKYNARRLCVIFRKIRKMFLRLDKCHEIPTFPEKKIQQIQGNSRENQAHSKQESMWAVFDFFVCFLFFEKWSILKGFSGQEEENLQ